MLVPPSPPQADAITAMAKHPPLSEDLAGALSVQCQCSNGHVTMEGGLNHVTDCCDFVVGQPLRHGARAIRPVIEGTGRLGSNPCVVAGGREPENPKRGRQRHGLPRSVDGAKENALGSGTGHSAEVELESRDALKSEDEPQECREHRDSILELDDAIAQDRPLLAIVFDRHYLSQASPNPAHRRGARYAEFRE